MEYLSTTIKLFEGLSDHKQVIQIIFGIKYCVLVRSGSHGFVNVHEIVTCIISFA